MWQPSRNQKKTPLPHFPLAHLYCMWWENHFSPFFFLFIFFFVASSSTADMWLAFRSVCLFIFYILFSIWLLSIHSYFVSCHLLWLFSRHGHEHRPTPSNYFRRSRPELFNVSPTLPSFPQPLGLHLFSFRHLTRLVTIPATLRAVSVKIATVTTRDLCGTKASSLNTCQANRKDCMNTKIK